MSALGPQVRCILEQDLDAVLHVQAQCYEAGYHEPRTAFANKLAYSPGTAWLVEHEGTVQAYLFTLPVDERHFPVLHGSDWAPPPQPRWLYLHDLAVSPACQGMGLAGHLMQQALRCAHTLQLEGLALVAVQGAEAYWTRQGFQACTPRHPVMQQRLASFGPDALFMMRHP